MNADEIAHYIDHTELRPDATDDRIRTLCAEADEYGFASVCVMPYYVPLAYRFLEELGSGVAVCTTIGFPNGAHQSVVKAAEARKAIHDGAGELDMVMNLAALKSGHIAVVLADIQAVVDVAREAGAIVKVILETSLLDEEQKRLACELAWRAGANFVKTSTGFGGGGATLDDVRLLRRSTPPEIGVKASGGIRDYTTAIEMIRAGASRIGTSSSLAIVSGTR